MGRPEGQVYRHGVGLARSASGIQYPVSGIRIAVRSRNGSEQPFGPMSLAVAHAVSFGQGGTGYWLPDTDS